jgi:sugar O-acyltransferase (sialic acid O-acetyltransferase NeuD family)
LAMTEPTKDIVVVGASGFGKEVAFLIEEINAEKSQWNLLGFLDDDPNKQTLSPLGYKVLGGLDWLKNHRSAQVAIGVGDPSIRRQIVGSLKPENVIFPSLVHPGTVIHESSLPVKDGVIICASNTLTVEIKVGDHSHINLDCTIGHGAVLSPFCTLSPGVHVSGDVTLGENVFIGTGANLLPGVSIGQGSIIGAGATVIGDIESRRLAAGVPAKVIKELPPLP